MGTAAENFGRDGEKILGGLPPFYFPVIEIGDYGKDAVNIIPNMTGPFEYVSLNSYTSAVAKKKTDNPLILGHVMKKNNSFL